MFKILSLCTLLFHNHQYWAKSNSTPAQMKIPSPTIAFHNDTEILHVFKELFLKYHNKMHKSTYYKHLATELLKKAQFYQTESIKLENESKKLLSFITQKITQHKALQAATQKQGYNSILSNAAKNKIDNRKLENFIRNEINKK